MDGREERKESRKVKVIVKREKKWLIRKGREEWERERVIPVDWPMKTVNGGEGEELV